jgi:beta-phosphoglucomutase-like phosphatase (HAD superfamily)
MLIVFNLIWDKFNVDALFGAATRRMNALAVEKGVGHHIIFNMASLGAGERLVGMPRFAGQEPPARVMDYLRRRHARILRDLNKSETVKAYRDAAEMLDTLKKSGHRLAAVHDGPTDEAESHLKKARMLDYFGDAVIGRDRVTARSRMDVALYLEAMRQCAAIPKDSVVVADRPKAVSAAAPLRPRAVAAYLPPYLEEDKITSRLKEMAHAGASYAFCGGYNIAALPVLLTRSGPA